MYSLFIELLLKAHLGDGVGRWAAHKWAAPPVCSSPA